MARTLAPDGPAVMHAPSASVDQSLSPTESVLYRKIILRIVPLAIIGYVIAYIDRINVGFAKLQFAADLGFSDAVYGVGAGLFFAGYFLFEVPSNLLMRRIGARATFVRIMVVWGALTVGMAFIRHPIGFYVMRFLLGVAEAGFFPGIILYFSDWFPKAIRAKVTAFFASGASIAGVVGSPLSGWLMSLDGLHGLRGWQILFIYEGLPAILLGIICLFAVADSPQSASWLTDEEKALVGRRLAAEKDHLPPQRHGGLLTALRNTRVYLMALAYLSILAATQAVALWTPGLLKTLHVPANQIGLLTALPFICAVVVIVALGQSSDYFQERRWHFAAAITVAGLALIFSGWMPFTVLSILVTMSLVASGAWSALAVFWSIPPAVLNEHEKAAGIGFVSSAGAIGGFISPMIIGWSSTTLGSLFPGLAVIGGMLVISALLVLGCVKSSALVQDR